MIFHRVINLPNLDSFFLFGPRGVGKSSLLKAQFPSSSTYYIDLLLPATEDKFARSPDLLIAEVASLPSNIKYVIIDEIQKVPRLLDVIHHLIEHTSKIFVMTGSSARKLRHGGANLLAGRAFARNLYPLTKEELGSHFVLEDVLRWGSLPKVCQLDSAERKDDFLFAYATTYLKEEIQAEQLVRKVDPFRKFLEVAAQSSGKLVNFANISRDTGVDAKTVKSYYEILEDTLVGFWLEPFHTSVRKRLKQAAKFYFFDTGVSRALARQLPAVPVASTSLYGDLFEQLVINEFIRTDSYLKTQCRFSYLRTSDDAEIDLIIERAGSPLSLIEIKSSHELRLEKLKAFKQFMPDFPDANFYCLSNDPTPKVVDGIHCLPWFEGIKTILATIK